jgi:hypothetical protein
VTDIEKREMHWKCVTKEHTFIVDLGDLVSELGTGREEKAEY